MKPDPHADIEGVLYDANNNNPMNLALVKLSDTEGLRIAKEQTDKDGKFSFDSLSIGGYLIETSFEDYEIDSVYVIVEKYKSLQIRLELGGIISTCAFDKTGHIPTSIDFQNIIKRKVITSDSLMGSVKEFNTKTSVKKNNKVSYTYISK